MLHIYTPPHLSVLISIFLSILMYYVVYITLYHDNIIINQNYVHYLNLDHAEIKYAGYGFIIKQSNNYCFAIYLNQNNRFLLKQLNTP